MNAPAMRMLLNSEDVLSSSGVTTPDLLRKRLLEIAPTLDAPIDYRTFVDIIDRMSNHAFLFETMFAQQELPLCLDLIAGMSVGVPIKRGDRVVKGKTVSDTVHLLERDLGRDWAALQCDGAVVDGLFDALARQSGLLVRAHALMTEASGCTGIAINYRTRTPQLSVRDATIEAALFGEPGKRGRPCILGGLPLLSWRGREPLTSEIASGVMECAEDVRMVEAVVGTRRDEVPALAYLADLMGLDVPTSEVEITLVAIAWSTLSRTKRSSHFAVISAWSMRCRPPKQQGV